MTSILSYSFGCSRWNAGANIDHMRRVLVEIALHDLDELLRVTDAHMKDINMTGDLVSSLRTKLVHNIDPVRWINGVEDLIKRASDLPHADN